jgi:hypothetical protein
MKMVAELRNDGSSIVPEIGAQVWMGFDAARAAILPDADTKG